LVELVTFSIFGFSYFAWFWKGLHVFILQIVAFVWRINACRVYDKGLSYLLSIAPKACPNLPLQLANK
jgi:hypothetical protein